MRKLCILLVITCFSTPAIAYNCKISNDDLTAYKEAVVELIEIHLTVHRLSLEVSDCRDFATKNKKVFIEFCSKKIEQALAEVNRLPVFRSENLTAEKLIKSCRENKLR